MLRVFNFVSLRDGQCSTSWDRESNRFSTYVTGVRLDSEKNPIKTPKKTTQKATSLNKFDRRRERQFIRTWRNSHRKTESSVALMLLNLRQCYWWLNTCHSLFHISPACPWCVGRSYPRIPSLKDYSAIIRSISLFIIFIIININSDSD